MNASTKLMQARKKAYYKVIRDHTSLIVSNVEVEDFRSWLIQDYVFEESGALDDITEKATRKKRAVEFVTRLEGVSLEKLRKALDAMKHTYPHVHDPIKAGIKIFIDILFISNC